MEQFDLNHLTMFINVMETGSFVGAANKLQIPKSKVSRAIATLEHLLGGQLFFRTTRDVRATELAQRLYHHVAIGLTALQTGLQDARNESVPMSGTFRITSVDEIGNHIIAPVITRFSEKYPLVKFDMIFTRKILNLVKESIDIAVRIGTDAPQSHRVQEAGFVRFIFVASPRFLQLRSIGRTDMSRIDILEKLDALVLFKAPFDVMRLEVMNEGQRQVIRLRPRHSCNALDSLIVMAKAGNGVALVPAFMAKQGLRDGSLVEVCRGWHLKPVPVSIITPVKKKLSPVVDAVTVLLREALRQEL
jgi:DNA-binding transcriptional LysR family regulator